MLVAPGPGAAAPLVWQPERLPAGTETACTRDDAGFSVEVAVPAAYLDARQGGRWEAFRLNVAVDDFDGPDRGCQLWWRPDWRTDETWAGSGTFVRE